jgi:hypothetical protein
LGHVRVEAIDPLAQRSDAFRDDPQFMPGRRVSAWAAVFS